MADRRGSPTEAGPGLLVLGQAVTVGEARPLGVEDPVIAARAVRRALADARRRASEVESVVVAATYAISPDTLMAFARRALGPHGASVRAMGIESRGYDASALADVATAQVLTERQPDPGAHGVVLAVGLGADGTTVARCLAPGGHRGAGGS